MTDIHEIDDFKNRVDLGNLQDSVQQLKSEIGKIIVGQHEMIELLVISILADGHVLLEGVPGVAKTLTAKLMARTISAGFSRIQFTPDLMPSDVIGTSIFNLKISEFEFKKGPIFSNIILIDEINRAPAKTQAALFECMQEKQVTIDGQTYILEAPFLVLATQNPIEQEGTYRLPEAQLDRFIFKINVDYPKLEEEISLLQHYHEKKGHFSAEDVQPVLTKEAIRKFREIVQEIRVENKLMDYIARLVDQTRNNKSLFLGASPRASLAIMNGAKALAAISGRDFITPEDIKYIAPHVLRHRIILTPEREMEGVTTDLVVRELIDVIEVPR